MKRTAVVAIAAVAGLMFGTWAWAQQGSTGQGMMGAGPGGTGVGSGMMGQQAPGPGAGPRSGIARRPMGMGGWMRFAERPLISEMLSAREQLGLSPAQVEKLRGLRSDFEKDAIKKQADIRVAEVDLSDLFAASSPDLGKIEAQVMKIATLRGGLRFARIKTLEEGRAVLSQEQWQKFQNIEPWPRGPHGGQWQQGRMQLTPHGMMAGYRDSDRRREGLLGPAGMMRGHGPDEMMGAFHQRFASHDEQM